MPLVDAVQQKILESWNLFRFWQRHRTALAQLARRTYHRLRLHGAELQVRAESTASALTIALQGTSIFIQLCENKEKEGAPPAMRPVFAHVLARYIIDMDWPTIIIQP